MIGPRRKVNKQSKVFEIIEKPLPLHGWKPEDGFDHLNIVEQDIRSLMRELAEIRYSRAENEKQYISKTKKHLLNILEVLDYFEILFDNINKRKELVTGKVKKWINSFHTIQRLLRKSLIEQGITQIENLDQGFDPHWHKVSETVSDNSKPDGTIIEEIKRGYVWQNQILRKVEVVVVRNSEADGTGEIPGEQHDNS